MRILECDVMTNETAAPYHMRYFCKQHYDEMMRRHKHKKLWDTFAFNAMQTIMLCDRQAKMFSHPPSVAREAFAMADAMLAAHEELFGEQD